MRFKRVELSPANKRQYIIALGVKDIELSLGEARNAARYTPNVGSNKINRERLDGIRKGLEKAYEQAKLDGDEGERVPLEDRKKYKQAKEANPMLDITRMEVVDHRKCNNCEGNGIVRHISDTARGVPCRACSGSGVRGRYSIFQSKHARVTSSVQDNGHTLKLFVDDRKPEEMFDSLDDFGDYAFNMGNIEKIIREMRKISGLDN